MKKSNPFAHRKPSSYAHACRTGVRARLAFALLCLVLICCAPLYAQNKTSTTTRPRKLPSPEKIVGDYLKTIGGKQRVAAIRDATYEWSVKLRGESFGEGRTRLKAPGAMRGDLILPVGERSMVANASSAWEGSQNGDLRTMTGTEANVLRLVALLQASRLVDYKKQNVLARTVAFEERGNEPAYVVEFSMRNGAQVRYWFGASTKLLLKAGAEIYRFHMSLGDYRAEAAGVLEPHLVEMRFGGESGVASFNLQRVVYNTGLSDTLFDPPRSSEALNIPALLREVSRNQDLIDERVSEYTFKQKITEREINGRGEIKKETVRVYEVYPLPNRAPVFRLISEGGVPLSAERAAKEERRVTEELVKAEQNRERDKQKSEEQKQKRLRKRQEQRAKERGSSGSGNSSNSGDGTNGNAAAEDEDEELGISAFLRACEFVAPRRERFRDRDAVVFDFRPRPGFRPSNRNEEIISKLVGVVWIDPVDKQVMRLEAQLAEGFKIGGGLLLSLRKGAAFRMEQTRMSDGVWLPLLAELNFSVKLFLFKGSEVNNLYEYSDYRRFDAETNGYKIDPTREGNATPAKPNQ
jgi:hypothetical protein